MWCTTVCFVKIVAVGGRCYCASAADLNKCFYDTTMDAVGLERARLTY